jgi:hypothetical protein
VIEEILAAGDLASGSSESALGIGSTDAGCEDIHYHLGGSEARLVLHPAANTSALHTGSAAAGAPLLHAGAIFGSVKEFKQAVKQDQELFKTKAILHKGVFQPINGAFICRATHTAIRAEGIASTIGSNGAQERQWWRHVCAGACGFVAEARVAHGKKLQPTQLGKVTLEHVKDNPLAAAACEVGVNGVRQGQWVVTLYAPHTCMADAAILADASAIPATSAAATNAATAPDAAAALAAVPAFALAPCVGTGADVSSELASPATAQAMPGDPCTDPWTLAPTAALMETTPAADGNADVSGGSRDSDLSCALTVWGSAGGSGGSEGWTDAVGCYNLGDSKASLALQPTPDAPLLHAGCIFDTREEFRQALLHGQSRFTSKAVLHHQQTSGAFICRDTF